MSTTSGEGESEDNNGECEEPEVEEEGKEDDNEEEQVEDDQGMEDDELSDSNNNADVMAGDHEVDSSADEEVVVHTFKQNKAPQKGDMIICYNDRDNRWMIIKLTSDMIKYYKDYYNYRCIRTGEEGGQYLRKQGHWGYITDNEAENIDPDQMVAPIAQVDGGVTPDSLTPAGSFVDDDYSDQESVFGDCEMEYLARSLDGKSTRTHEDQSRGSEYDRNVHLSRISQTMNLELRPMTIEVEQYMEFPSAASFPENDVEVQSYHYHLARGRVLSISSPELREERTSEATWLSRMTNWRKRWRRRLE